MLWLIFGIFSNTLGYIYRCVPLIKTSFNQPIQRKQRRLPGKVSTKYKQYFLEHFMSAYLSPSPQRNPQTLYKIIAITYDQSRGQ